MATLNFPSDPAVDDQYTFNGKTWAWNGSGWALVPFENGGVTELNTMTGAITIQAGENVVVSAQSGNVIEIAVPDSPGVDSLNTMVGDVQLQAGSNVTVTPRSGNVLEIAASGSAGGVTDLNSMVGSVLLQAGSGVTITPQSGNVLLLGASATAGVNSLNTMTGDVTLQAGSNITLTPQSGNVILIASSGSGGASYDDVILADNPRNYYKMNETSGTTCTDYGTAAINGTYVNSPSLNQTSGLYSGAGACAEFSGGSSFPNMTFALGLGTFAAGGGIIAECVFYNASTTAGGCFMYMKWDAKAWGVGQGTTTADTPGSNLVVIQEGNAWYANGVTLTPGWHHLALVWNKSGAQLLVILDGAPVIQGSTTGAVNADSSSTVGSGTRAPNQTTRFQNLAFFYMPLVVNSSYNSFFSLAMSMVRRHYQAFKRGI